MVRSGRAPVDPAPDCLSPPLLLHAASSTAPDPTRNDLRLTPATTGRTYRRTMAADSQLTLSVNGRSMTVADDGASLLEVLRDRARDHSAKDGCSPQGQCGCCTVLVDGEPRVACVTPARRVAGRSITTLEGMGERGAALGRRLLRDRCEPMRVLHARHHRAPGRRCASAASRGDDIDHVERALLAHLCRCTGWRTILDAWRAYDADATRGAGRDLERAAARASLEGGAPQRVGPNVALGGGGFADDTAPADALVAVPDGRGGWSVGETLARRAGAPRQRCRDDERPLTSATRSRCPMAIGTSRCRPNGSSRPISRRTPRGVRPAESRHRRSPTAVRSGARSVRT